MFNIQTKLPNGDFYGHPYIGTHWNTLAEHPLVAQRAQDYESQEGIGRVVFKVLQ